MAIQPRLQLVITSPDGSARRRLPRKCIGVPEWGGDRKNGYAAISIPTTLPYSSGAPNVSQGDLISVFYDGILRYSGSVTGRKKSDANPNNLTIEGQGTMYLLRKQPCGRNFAFPAYSEGVDVGVAFAKFAQQGSATVPPLSLATGVGGRKLITSVDAQVIGTNVNQILAQDKLAGDVLDKLDQLCGNMASMGCDINTVSGETQLYIRPLASLLTPTHTVIMPAKRASKVEADEQTADLTNVLIVTGGNPKWPNLIHNGGFELPIQTGSGEGSIILNGSFETGGFHVADHWNFSNGATTESGKGDGDEHASAFDGTRYLELDHGGEEADQTAPADLTAGHNYVLTFYAAKEIDDQILSGTATLQLNGPGLSVPAMTLPIVPPDSAYHYFVISFVAPAGVTSVTVKFSLGSIIGSGGGLVIDLVECYDVNDVYQDGWITQSQGGSAAVNAVNWIYDADSWEGAYCVYLDVTASDEDGHDLQLRPPNTSRMQCQAGQTLIFSAWLKTPPDGTSMPKLLLEIDWFNSSGGYISRTGHDSSPTNPLAGSPDEPATLNGGETLSDWTYFYTSGNAPGGATQCDVTITARSSGAFLIDGVTLQDAAATQTYITNIYQPDGPLIYIIHASDSTDLLPIYQAYYAAQNEGEATPSSTPYQGSEGAFGSRCAVYQDDNILAYSDALQIANNWFLGNSQVDYKPDIEIVVDNGEVYWSGDSIRLVGADGPSMSGGQVLSIERWNERCEDDILYCNLQVQKEAVDEVIIVNKLIAAYLRLNGPSANSTGYSGGYSNPTSGVIGTGGITGVDVQDASGGLVKAASAIYFTGATVVQDGDNIYQADVTVTAGVVQYNEAWTSDGTAAHTLAQTALGTPAVYVDGSYYNQPGQWSFSGNAVTFTPALATGIPVAFVYIGEV